MDEPTRAQIFEPFFTTKPRGRGTGLGLSTVYGIVTQATGRVAVQSRPGAGTRVDVTFPSVEAAPDAPADQPAAAAPLGGSETVLVAEDDEAARRLLVQVLEQQGYRVVAAADAREALRIAEATDRVDMLVTDLVMPDLTGRELAAILLARNPLLPVLYVSGWADDPLDLSDPALGACDFLQKPFAPESLAAKVRELLDARGVRG